MIVIVMFIVIHHFSYKYIINVDNVYYLNWQIILTN